MELFLRLKSVRVLVDRDDRRIEIAVPLDPGSGSGQASAVTVTTLNVDEARRLSDALRRAVHAINYPGLQS